jgi:hypothetical protein
MRRACGVSSTPRPFDSVITVSGILDYPHARVMTTESVARSYSSDIVSHSRGTMRPSFDKTIAQERAWGMPGARCTRSLVCKVLVAHECRRHRYSGSPGIPARNGFNGFLRALPGDRACLPPSPAELACPRPVGPTCLRKLDASVGASGPHDFAVRACVARQRAVDRSRAEARLPSRHTPNAAASTASRPASVTIAIRPSLGTRRRGI